MAYGQRTKIQWEEICIGVETEAPLAVTKSNETNTDELLQGTEALIELARLFNKHNLNAYHSAVDHEHDFSKWAITFDSSIDVKNELLGIGSPIEIKSPRLLLGSSPHEERFRIMWGIIERFKIPSIEYWKMASTHVHFSVQHNPRFPIDVAQKLAFCAVYFERAIDEILPKMTHKNDIKRLGGWKHCDRFAKRNRVRPKFNGRRPLDDLKACWEHIRDTKDIYELNDLMCYDDDAYRRSYGQTIKNWKWNFKGLGFKTIEFRHMPPSRSAQETLDWISFTTKFVLAAAKVNRDKLDKALKTNETCFTEALGYRTEGFERGSQPVTEQLWAADGKSNAMTPLGLKRFLGADDDLWERIMNTKAQIESELASLP